MHLWKKLVQTLRVLTSLKIIYTALKIASLRLPQILTLECTSRHDLLVIHSRGDLKGGVLNMNPLLCCGGRFSELPGRLSASKY